IVAGRNFSDKMPTDSSALIINEAGAKLLGFTDPIDKPLYGFTDNMAKNLRKYHIIGVVKNFNFRSLRETVTPMLLEMADDRGAMTVRVNTSDIAGLIDQIKTKWKQFVPNQEFQYQFMDDDFNALYRSERRMGKIAISFTVLAIIIACLGLFGLAAYAAEQRTKEIGIRKVLGANVSTIVRLLSKDFILLVFLAILFAAPVAWYFMHKWLQGFAYHQSVQWWIVAVSGLGAVLIAFATISFQSVKAALANPVKSLRSE
ncbi:MAG TPA: FtsX-like permease family protein, partial [Mucilaginibacter sp.]|nr:FtsX-like permease family protein [Mucilaginibacter sp.]